MATFSRIKIWVSNEVLTATDLNGEFDNIINNMAPGGLEDISNNIAAMQTTVDPGGIGAESLATTLAGELQRLRFMIKFLLGKTQWYDHTGRSFAAGALAILNADITDASVTTSKIVDANVTTAKIADGSITRPKLIAVGQVLSGSSGTLTNTGSTTPIQVPNLSLSITTTGRPVSLELIHDGSGSFAGYFGASSGGQFQWWRDGSRLFSMSINGSNANYPPGAMNMIDYGATAAVHTYALYYYCGGSGNIVYVSNCQMVAREL